MGAGARRNRAHFSTPFIGTLPPELESKLNLKMILGEISMSLCASVVNAFPHYQEGKAAGRQKNLPLCTAIAAMTTAQPGMADTPFPNVCDPFMRSALRSLSCNVLGTASDRPCKKLPSSAEGRARRATGYPPRSTGVSDSRSPKIGPARART
jgi:hypothetical protein